MQVGLHLVSNRDDDRREDDEQHLRSVACNQHPALLGRVVAMEAREDERAETERDDGGQSLDPPNAFMGCDDSQTQIDGVS